MINHVFIIAEAGVNHNGDLCIAKKMIDVAKEAGVDAIKFQTFQTKNIVTKKAQKANYQLDNTDKGETQYEMLKKLELTYDMHIELIKYCKEKEIMFLSTPFDEESLKLLEELKIDILKVPSGEITNYPFLKKLAHCELPIILSTGMSTEEEIQDALTIFKKNENISILHCTTQYPAPLKDIHLNVIPLLKKRFQIPVGYSDHTEGIEVAIAAVAMGATIIEKHFTLDRTMEGPDHKASIEPEELKKLVTSIRNIELALGDCEKKVTESEVGNRIVARKSIVAKNRIKKGDLFSEENLTTKRPGSGINPMKWNEIIGTKAERDYEMDEMIE